MTDNSSLETQKQVTVANKREFTPHERYGIFTAHGERCYLCRCPLDLYTMEVDHVIPESLLAQPLELSDVLAEFGRPASFDLQSFANWLPSCRPCNNRKRSHVFDPVPIVLRLLDEAARKAPRAAELAAQSLTKQAISRSWNTILRAAATGKLTDDIKAAIGDLGATLLAAREPTAASAPLRLTPLLTVLNEDGRLRVVQGPFGIGVAPADLKNSHPTWRCGVCGNAAWNGARCVACGNLEDD